MERKKSIRKASFLFILEVRIEWMITPAPYVSPMIIPVIRGTSPLPVMPIKAKRFLSIWDCLCFKNSYEIVRGSMIKSNFMDKLRESLRATKIISIIYLSKLLKAD